MVAKGHNYGNCRMCGKIHIAPMHGKHLGRETREKMSLAKQGQIPWWIIKGLPNPMKNLEIRKKHLETMQSPEHLKKLIGHRPYLLSHSAETRGKMSLSHTGKPSGIKGKRIPSITGNKNPAKRLEVRKKMSNVAIDNILNDPKRREAVLQSLAKGRKMVHRRPNRFEKIINEIISQNAFPFLYNNNKIIINNHCSDFIHDNGQHKVILCNGIYWHLQRFQKENPSLTKEDVEKMERKPYENAGYNVSFIWEDELKDLNEVTKKIREFTDGF